LSKLGHHGPMSSMGDEIDASFKNRRHNAPNLLD